MSISEAIIEENRMKDLEPVGDIAIGALRRIIHLPSTETERMKGKWIRITQGAIPEQYICPFCHRTVESYGVEELLPIRYPYCHCGADMRGEEDDTTREIKQN